MAANPLDPYGYVTSANTIATGPYGGSSTWTSTTSPDWYVYNQMNQIQGLQNQQAALLGQYMRPSCPPPSEPPKETRATAGPKTPRGKKLLLIRRPI